jgi:SulP family sulfate permease
MDMLVVLIIVALGRLLGRLDRAGQPAARRRSPLPAQCRPAADAAYSERSNSAGSGRLAPDALAIAFLGLLEALAIAKSIANETRQTLDFNRQCLAEGIANLTGSFFRCLPGSGSLSRSAINFQAGGATRFSGHHHRGRGRAGGAGCSPRSPASCRGRRWRPCCC